MAGFEAVQRGLGRGFERGFATGGKLGGLGSVIAKVANKLKTEREGEEALDVLGETERIKAGIKQEFAGPTPYGPEAQEFVKFKAGLEGDQAIVDAAGNIIGHRPKGSVFQPKEDPFQKYFFGRGVEPSDLTGEKSLRKPISTPKGDRISVVHPDGRRGDIPKSQLREALAEGFKRTL